MIIVDPRLIVKNIRKDGESGPFPLGKVEAQRDLAESERQNSENMDGFYTFLQVVSC